MATIRSFAAPHKGLRSIISKFTTLTGYADMADPERLAALKTLGNEMFALLKDHVHTENTHTLRYLEERAPGSSAHDHADHDALEAVQDGLEKRFLALNSTESAEEQHLFYLDMSKFQSIYYEHIYHEETETEKLLQEHFTDEELLQHRMAIIKGLEFPTLKLWLKYIIPAQAIGDSAGMLSGMKATAPPEAFESVLATIKTEMDPNRFITLVAAIK